MTIRSKVLLVASVYPATICLLGITPYVCLFFFSLRGGPGWLFGLTAFPWFISCLCFYRRDALPFLEQRRLIAVSVGVYLLLTGAASLVIAKSLSPLGADISARIIWATLNMPMGLAAW